MAHINKVIQSIETPDGGRCVDIFARPDGTFGFEEYRREAEDGRGWFPLGFHGNAVYDSEAAARADALVKVGWLADAATDS